MSLLDLEVKHLKYDRIDRIHISKPEQEVITNAAQSRPIHIPKDVIVWHWTKFWEQSLCN